MIGPVTQGGVIFAKVEGAVKRVEYPGHRVVVSEDGSFPIAFSRLAQPKQKLVVHFADGTKLEHVFQVEQRTYVAERIDGLPEEQVKLDAATKQKLAAAEARIDAVRRRYGKKPCYREGFAWPAVGRVTSRYGQPRILNGVDAGIHWGVDIAAPVGTPVRAPTCGTVVFAEKNLPLSGNTLILDHGHGISSTFIHLADLTRHVGEEVKKGDVVATVGTTGRTIGPHLHWAMNVFAVRIDPELLVPDMPAQ